MDQSPTTPNPEMPRPERAAQQHVEGRETIAPKPEKNEKSSVEAGELIKQATQAVNQAAQDSALVDDSGIQNQTSAIQAVTDSSIPIIADDVDVIEKEWVQKAKQIVSQTKDDPHKQSVELTKFKHDYMNKRYGKEIKLPDEQAA
jgi:hypothetical protein